MSKFSIGQILAHKACDIQWPQRHVVVGVVDCGTHFEYVCQFSCGGEVVSRIFPETVMEPYPEPNTPKGGYITTSITRSATPPEVNNGGQP